MQAHSLTTEYSTTFVQKFVYFFAALGKELNLFHENEIQAMMISHDDDGDTENIDNEND